MDTATKNRSMTSGIQAQILLGINADNLLAANTVGLSSPSKKMQGNAQQAYKTVYFCPTFATRENGES